MYMRALLDGRAFFIGKEGRAMDLLLQCARVFAGLTSYQYNIVIGRKGKTISFSISFDYTHFHHLAGLHKLKDNYFLRTGNRKDIIEKILTGRLTCRDIQHSAFYSQIEPRLLPLSDLENFLDSNQIIFRYSKNKNPDSRIEADYLLQNISPDSPVFLFTSEDAAAGSQICRSIFPCGKYDYTKNQSKYTLLKKEKQNILTGKTTEQYISKSFAPR